MKKLQISALLCFAVGMLLTGCQTAPRKPSGYSVTPMPPVGRQNTPATPHAATSKPLTVVPMGVPTQTPRPVSYNAWRNAANEWLGVRHVEGGLTKSGVDCSGLTLQLYRKVADIRLPHSSLQQSQYGAPVPVSGLRPGDLLFFITSGRGINHVGLSLGADQFVHATLGKGVIISSLREAYYVRTFVGARRIIK